GERREIAPLSLRFRRSCEDFAKIRPHHGLWFFSFHALDSNLNTGAENTALGRVTFPVRLRRLQPALSRTLAAEGPMKRTWTIIGVADVPQSFKLVPVATWPAGDGSYPRLLRANPSLASNAI